METTKLTNVEVANKALDYMKERLDSYGYTVVSTIPMMHSIGLKDDTGNRTKFRSVLDRLARAGKVSKYGTGKFKWKILVETWDRSNPFDGATEVKDHVKNGYGTKDTSEPDTDEPEEPSETEPAVPSPSSNGHAASTNPAAVVQLERRVAKLETELRTAEESIETAEGGLRTLTESLAATVKKLEESSRSVKTLEIKRWDDKIIKLKNVVLPAEYEHILDLAKCRRNILLVGPAGCGKSHTAKLIADTFGFNFGSVSLTAGISESHLLGKSVPNLTTGEGRFQGTDFVSCYESGGVYLLDEIDAADPNLLLAINSALANGYCNLPNRPKKPRAVKHTDFICIATANTFGRGATRQYSGRNQLDESTLDRFRIGIVECKYDMSVELALCPDDSLRGVLQKIRKGIEEHGLRRIMSTRFLQDAYVMKSVAKWDDKRIVEVFLNGWTDDEKYKIESYTTAA